MIAIFDANVWKSHLYMNAPLRASAVLYLQRKGGVVALPEVIRLEVERHLRRDLRDFRDTASANYTKLLKMFGTLKEASFPTDDRIDALVGEFFRSSGFRIRDVPFSLESAQDAFLRTIDKRPPSSKSQEFKDGVIWADAMRLAEEDDVFLITQDKAFFEGFNPSSGLASDLRKEAESKPFTVTVFSNFYDFMEVVAEPITIDVDQILGAMRASKVWS